MFASVRTSARISDIVSGAYLGPAGRDRTSGTPRPVRLPAGADDPDPGAWLWRESERLTGVTFPAPLPRPRT
ncbi:hypothetical protein ACFUAC_21510 [Streptomyces sp. NPDC057148]|uniref:hypothetical protein n=1 Tax=unclassified Streptomyces TaxID=2593676 RepID=UPI0036289075